MKKRLDVGMYFDLPADVYHADPCVKPSLSRSLAFTLAQQSALHGWLEHPRLNPNYKPRDPNKAMDFGSLAHEIMLCGEERIDVGKWKNFKTDAAQDWRDGVRKAGRIPALLHDMEKARELRISALRQIEAAGFLQSFATGKPEVTVIAKRGESFLRCRFDNFLIDPEGAKHRMHSEIAIWHEIKITHDANPLALKKLIGNQGYELQEHFYLETLNAFDKKFAGKTRVVFFFIEDEPPFMMTPVELTNRFKAIGRSRFDRAILKWEHGRKTGEWPTYCAGEGTFAIGPPTYLERQELEGDDFGDPD